jgi:hypothetical protein
MRKVIMAAVASLAVVMGIAGSSAAAAPVPPNTIDALRGTGSISAVELRTAFEPDLDASVLNQRVNEIRFRRDGEERWTVTCLPVGGPSYTEDYVRTYVVYANSHPIYRNKGKAVDSVVLDGWINPQTFSGPDVGSLTQCSNGDPISQVTWTTNGFRWDWPNVAPVFRYQRTALVAEYNGVDSAVLARYPVS